MSKSTSEEPLSQKFVSLPNFELPLSDSPLTVHSFVPSIYICLESTSTDIFSRFLSLTLLSIINKSFVKPIKEKDGPILSLNGQEDTEHSINCRFNVTFIFTVSPLN